MTNKTFASRLIRVLVILYWISFWLSVFFVIAMMIPEIAVYLRIMQLAGGAYLGFPGTLSIYAFMLSFGFSNFWWVLLLLSPIVVLRHSHPIRGFIISIVAFAVLLYIPPIIIKYQSEYALAGARTALAPIVSTEKIASVTIFADGCNQLCERLLAGNSVDKVRTSKPKAKNAAHLQYHRASAKECQAFDPFFINKDICILARPDDGENSDISIEQSYKGSRAIKRSMVGFSPKILSRKTISIRQLETQKIVASDTRVWWIEPTGYVPLLANTGFDGRGINGGGLVPRQRKREDSAIDVAALLDKMGINLAPTRVVVIRKRNRYSRKPKTRREPAPYDVALISSIKNLEGLGGRTASAFLESWSSHFSRKEVSATQGENLFLSNNLFVFLKKGSKYKISLTSAFLNIVKKQTPEKNEIYIKPYLAILTDGPNDTTKHRLVEASGRFTFVPEPLLREVISQASQKKNLYGLFQILRATCQADKRWAKIMEPLVFEAIDILLASNEKRYKIGAIRRAFATFDVQGQNDSWLKLETYFSPDDLKKYRIPDYGKARCR